MELHRLYYKQQGFSLLEALIALVIFSVALLGLARMYTQMMSMSHSAYFRTLATIQANDFEERLRANPENVDDYALASCSNAPAGGDMAATDLARWCANSAALFGGAFYPGNTTVVDLVDDYEITIAWKERGLETGEQDFEDIDFVYRVSK
ncbi:type IV pilus assembly protein PilV [Marinobacterium halophilum]|uniref:Type IV pilus assembly protein PilV n=1 Tax=Marinobacterium halophilum TaxID=267374 RepID=A0A2P8F2B3_9GAMM|nr:type IV pilus modification protein PilV [Marinobacterium halophilum]PSL15855.1 type IV pilus assembly protein PilV [Marinobacterium halophilum]